MCLRVETVGLTPGASTPSRAGRDLCSSLALSRKVDERGLVHQRLLFLCCCWRRRRRRTTDAHSVSPGNLQGVSPKPTARDPNGVIRALPTQSSLFLYKVLPSLVNFAIALEIGAAFLFRGAMWTNVGPDEWRLTYVSPIQLDLPIKGKGLKGGSPLANGCARGEGGRPSSAKERRMPTMFPPCPQTILGTSTP